MLNQVPGMTVLVVDDDDVLARSICDLIATAGHRTVLAATGSLALARIETVDAVLVDLHLPDISGLEVVRRLRAVRPDLEVVVITGDGTVATAVEAMRLGARAYLVKPFEPEELLLHLREMAHVRRLRIVSAGRGRLVGGSRQMQRAYADIDVAAGSTAPVLVTGGTGTGKELAAQAIHEMSSRQGRAFVAVNCAAIPAGLAESELFGHEPGAFTGASSRRKGRFALAHGGTLFLDEVDSLPAEVQPKLLRALESGEFWALGAEHADYADVRIIAASNRELEREVAEGRLRGDLFWRLNVLRVRMPALAERSEDIPLLVRTILDRAVAERPDGQPRMRIEATPQALARLVAQPWPGNVRELGSAVARARARASAERPGADPLVIDARHLDPEVIALPTEPFLAARARAMEAWTRSTVAAALEAAGGRPTEAARLLKMGRTAFLRLTAKFDLRSEAAAPARQVKAPGLGKSRRPA